ncbi:hypothetical protein ABPG77_007216 [Micractinium sp. CCAP 211/92]
MQEPSHTREEAPAVFRAHEAAQAQGKPHTALHQALSSAHKEAVAAAEHASETLQSGRVDPNLPGMGDPASEKGAS